MLDDGCGLDPPLITPWIMPVAAVVWHRSPHFHKRHCLFTGATPVLLRRIASLFAMRAKTLAHLSDLHIGLSYRNEQAARMICNALLENAIDDVVITGDITHRGRLSELRTFQAIFAPLFEARKICVVPGNHDRLGDDVAEALMPGCRVDVHSTDGLHVVRVDSTGPQNYSFVAGHGEIDQEIVDRVGIALQNASEDCLRVALIHHHPLPLPEETLVEWFVEKMGWPYAAELSLGRRLLDRAAGICDLVLHGHRHIPREICFATGERPLLVYNAGSSTELMRFRVFRHAEGRLLGSPTWMDVRGTSAGIETEPALVPAYATPRLWVAAAVASRKLDEVVG